MNTLKIAGKYLDQPLLVSKFKKDVPYILSIGGGIYTAHKVKQAKANKRNETLLRTGTTMLFTILSALLAPKIVNKIFKNTTLNINEIKQRNLSLINTYLKENSSSTNINEILKKSIDKILTIKEIKTLYTDKQIDKKFLNKLIPEPENINSKEIFSEIGRLSLLGLIPVIGGIAGGISGDMVVDRDWKSRIPNKIKEGAYQYLANIFLCNIGAGIALGIMEKAGIKSKSGRATGMIAGILTTGVLGGSLLANLIGNKLINPIFGEDKNKPLFNERKPEALDIGLHVDDIATVAVMSGLKWIEPALPIMYAISGFRAGIGYRNVNFCNENKKVWNR